MAGPRIKIDILGDASKFKRAVDDVEAGTKQMEARFSGLAGKIATGFAAIGAGQFLKGAIDSAGDIGEQLSKLNVLVGDSADDIEAWSKTTAKSFGIARGEALVAAGDFANFFKTAGLSNEAAADMSKEFVELAADMASFNNASPAETLEALGAALRGESEPIRRFGVLLDDATLKQRALNMGLIQTTKETLPPAVKLQAAYAEVLAQTSKQQGDFQRTSQSAANQQRILAAEFKEMQTQIGVQLLPAWQELISLARELMPAMASVANVAAGLASGLAQVVKGVAGLGDVFGGAIIPVGAFTLGIVGTSQALEAVSGPAKAAYDAVSKLSGGLSALQAGGLVGLAAGGLLAAWFADTQAEAAKTRAQQEALSDTLRQAQDPTALLADKYKELAGSLAEVTGAGADAEDAVVATSKASLLLQLQTDGTLDTFNRLGLSVEQVNAVLSRGSAEEITTFRASLRSLAKDTGVSIDATDKLIGTTAAVAAAYRRERESIAESSRQILQRQVSLGKLTQSELDQAFASAKGRTESEKWYAVSLKFAPLLNGLANATGEQGDAAEEAAETTGDLAAATEDAADAAEIAEQAAKDQAEAIEELIKKQERQLELAEQIYEATTSAANADLAYVRQQRSMAESSQELVQAQANLDYAVRTYGAGSQQAAVAQYEYQKALDGTKSEALETAVSAVELAKKQAEAEGKTLAAKDANDLMITKLGELRDASGDPALKQYLDGLILQYQTAEIRARDAAAQVAELSRQMAIQKLGGSGAGGVATTSADTADRLLSGQRAAGGPVGANRSYLVGEDGPEVLTMGSQSGRITPNGALGGGGVTVVVNASGVIAQDLNAFAAAAASAIHEALRRLEAARR